MRLSDALNFSTFELAKKQPVYVSSSEDVLGAKATPLITRVSRDELLAAYRTDPVCFNGINIKVNTAMRTKPKLNGINASWFSLFLDGIGTRGGQMDWNRLRASIIRDCYLYGQAFVELIKDKAGTQILDLDILDCTRMDYLKDGYTNVALDEYGNPIGYVLTMPTYTKVTAKIKPPSPYSIKGNQIYLPRDRVAHIKLFTHDDGLYPTGLLEPIYKATKYKLALEKSITNALLYYAPPHMRAKVGDINHDASPDMIQNVLKSMKEGIQDGLYAYPYYYDVELIEAKNLQHLTGELEYYINQQVAGLGVPRAFVTGGGQETNRSTLNRQEYMATISLQEELRMMTYDIETKIFKPVAFINLKSEDYPEMELGDLSMEDLDNKAHRLVGYAQAGLIIPDSTLEEAIRQEEGLPEGDPDGRTAAPPISGGAYSGTDEAGMQNPP